MRQLTDAQHTRLDELDESMRVVGWSHDYSGPVIRDTSGADRTLRANGKLIPIRELELEA